MWRRFKFKVFFYYSKFLDDIEFRIIPIDNPLGRKEVEEGDYCKRSNLNGVDPNRNWNYHWTSNNNSSRDEGSGKIPFSEYETTFAKEELTKFLPDVFLTIHSGVFGLFYPYGSDMNEGVKNIKNIKNVLKGIKDKFCPWCSLTTPSKFLGYISHGNCLDYAYDVLNVKYSFAWEIYTNEINWKSYVDNYEADQSYDFDEANSNNSRENQCLEMFNPISQNDYSFMIEMWSKSIFYMLKEILSIENK